MITAVITSRSYAEDNCITDGVMKICKPAQDSLSSQKFSEIYPKLVKALIDDSVYDEGYGKVKCLVEKKSCLPFYLEGI